MKSNTECPRDDGFTLVELLIVVLILGILLAIAIPTFLSLTTGSRSKGAESNVTIAVGDESNYFTANSAYGSSALMQTSDSGLNWVACNASSCIPASDTGSGKYAYAWPTTDSSGYAAVVVGDAGSNGKDYWALATQNPSVKSPSLMVTTSTLPPTVATLEASGSATWSQAGG